jgi:uncharacterized protein YndB with AHSA1/START domain
MTDTEGSFITRTFAAPQKLVFEAWTTPAHFAKWFGGSGVEVPDDSVSMDLVPGGSWTATMIIGNGVPDMHWIGEFVEIDPYSKLILTISDGSPDRELVTVSFAEVDGGTEMQFAQTGGHLSVEEYERTAQGWQTFFDALAEVVEG